MDIRGFFSTGPQKRAAAPAPLGSALSDIRASAVPKSPIAAKKVKKRSAKVTQKDKIDDLVYESDSDGESPMPSSMRKSARASEDRSKKKRQRAIISSDDDTPKSNSPAKRNPVSKQPAKKARVSSEKESSTTPKKTKTVRYEEPELTRSDVEMLSESGDEDFVKKTTSKKKDVVKGQTKLSFDRSSVSKLGSKPVSGGVAGISTNKSTSAADYFAGISTSAPPALKTSSTPSNSSADKGIFSHSSNKSPSSKENTEKPQEIQTIKLPSKSVVVKKPLKVTPKNADNEFLSDSDEELPSTKKSPPKPNLKKEPSRTKKTKSPAAEDVPSGLVIENSPPKRSRTSEFSKPAKNIPSNSEVDVQSSIPLPVKQTDVNVCVPWVDKYKPMAISQLIGQHGEKSPLNKMLGWLRDWAKHNLGEAGKIKKPKPAVWAAQDNGVPFKAVLLSGTPGIGKTTCAHLACKTLGLKFIEMNASDVRNKKHLENQVAQLTGSHQIEEYFGSGRKSNTDDLTVHHVLVMDEVDGMSGNEDRAGISELIQIIKDTKIPIICICNDRSHPKMRSLVNYCFDIRFPKPRLEQIRPRIMSIICQEKLNIKKDEIDEIIELSGHDVRQTITNLQMRSDSNNSNAQKKDCSINSFEAARKLLDTRSTLMEKQEMFFVDYGIMPLFVQENYINMKNDRHTPAQTMACLRKAADLISLGDLADRCIRTTGSWKLLNEQCMFGCALPSIAVGGHLRSMITFPAWLGKNSTAGKRQRLMRQLASHAHLKISADTHSLVTDYVPVLRDCLTKPMLMEDTKAVIEKMVEYDLVKDDMEAINELANWPGKIDPASKIQPKVKAALTRALNKEHRMLPYAINDVAKGRKKADSNLNVELDEEGNLVERVEGSTEESIESDAEEEEAKPKVVIRNTAAAPAARGRGGARGGRGRGKTKA